MNFFKWIFKRKKKTKSFIVLRKSVPKYYGLCGRETIIHKIPTWTDDYVFKIAALLNCGFKIDGFEYSEQPLNRL